MDKTRIAHLIDLYYNKQLTELEFNELREAALHGDSEVLQQIMLEHMEGKLQPQTRGRVRTMILRWSAAAAVLLLLAPLYLVFTKNKKAVQAPAAGIAKTKDVLPGRSGAILTLSDGSKMALDSLGNGVITTQANTSVTLKNGQLIYGRPANNNPGALLYNTMSTPRGRQFQMVLPDGSKVWLNAASSITYPVAFSGNQRLVRVSGEAYFEIAADASMPFRVQLANGEKVEVLGTRFNVNAYEDERAVRTTLLDGKVRVSLGSSARVLEPGEQAFTENNDPSVKLIHDADVSAAIAWKNNYFSFTDADLPTVMRQLSRWYNVDVTFAGAIPAGEFNGKIGRTLTLDQVLKVLTATRVKYTIDKNKILILSE